MSTRRRGAVADGGGLEELGGAVVKKDAAEADGSPVAVGRVIWSCQRDRHRGPSGR